MVYWWFSAVHCKVRWSVASPGWSGKSAELQVRWTSLFMIWSGEQQFHLDGQVNNFIWLSWVVWWVRLISLSSGWLDWSSWHQCWWYGQVNSFSPDWPSWLSEQWYHQFGLLGLIGQVNISVNWLAGWHGWVTFNLLGWVTWSSHLGWQETLCYRWTLLSTGWLGWSSEHL